MKNLTTLNLVIFAFLFLFISGCADVIKEADSTFIDTTKLPLMFNPVDEEAERMLYEAMYTSPVKWESQALENVLSARGTLKMAGEYLENKEKTKGGITFFTLREFLDFTMYAFTIYESGADNRANQPEVLTDQEKWIYKRVKEDVWANLKSLRAYVDLMAEKIDGEVDKDTVERFKQAFSIVESIIPVKLPDNIDF